MDLGLSWMGTDIYGEMGIKLSEIIYPFTAIIAGIIGSGVYYLGRKMDNTADEDTYDGEWKNEKRHGQGTYTSADGHKYVGEWRDDLPHGHGTYTFANGDKYVGEFRADEYHGQGTFTHANGDS